VHDDLDAFGGLRRSRPGSVDEAIGADTAPAVAQANGIDPGQTEGISIAFVEGHEKIVSEAVVLGEVHDNSFPGSDAPSGRRAVLPSVGSDTIEFDVGRVTMPWRR
jgi:hypothetical protein